MLEVWRQALPDLGWMIGHKASQSSATVMSSFTASKVSLVETTGRDAASVVEATGNRKTMYSW